MTIEVDWKEAIRQCISFERSKSIFDGKCSIEVTLRLDKTRIEDPNGNDLDNFIKPIIDVLETEKVIDGEKSVYNISLRKELAIDSEGAFIQVREL